MTRSIGETKDLIKLNTNEVKKQIEDLKDAFDEIDDNYLRKKYLKASVNQTITPMLKTFKGLIPKLVTGNLKRSAAKKTVSYGDRIAVGLVGYSMTRKEDENAKGWAQGFIEYGTKDRFTKNGSIASSYNKRGPFTMYYGDNQEIELDPPYPVSFFKKSKRGEPVYLGRSPKGGQASVQPLQTTYKQYGPQALRTLESNMRKALTNAFNEQARRQNRRL